MNREGGRIIKSNVIEVRKRREQKRGNMKQGGKKGIRKETGEGRKEKV